mmetsp:Transcript_123952/g.246782  ORF Transcript_123952/g.246782 Transcript_123952/m.246782 type:complete len:781 (-) Transcript_123952:43-2385(-)
MQTPFLTSVNTGLSPQLARRTCSPCSQIVQSPVTLLRSPPPAAPIRAEVNGIAHGEQMQSTVVTLRSANASVMSSPVPDARLSGQGRPGSFSPLPSAPQGGLGQIGHQPAAAPPRRIVRRPCSRTACTRLQMPTFRRLTATTTSNSPKLSKDASDAAVAARLQISGRAREDLQELMRNKDLLRHYAEKPFLAKGLHPESHLCFEDFQQALKGWLRELDMSVPGDHQMHALFDKHRCGAEGVNAEEFEALLFRLLCFLRASDVVQAPHEVQQTASTESKRRWREDFIRKNPRKFNDVYVIGQQLGKGSFGTVHVVSLKTPTRNGRSRVCKIISKEVAHAAGTSEAKVREEFAVLKQLDHPHVLRIFEDFEDEESFYVVMEPCHGGDLASYVRCMEPMSAARYEFWVAKVMQHTVLAAAYCHSKAIIHKDLKPENVMLSTPKGTKVEDMHVVVVDFGLAEMFSHPTDRSKVIAGTPPFMAPEVWRGNFSKSCDVWSVGCMLFFLLSGRLPFVATELKDFAKAVLEEPDWRVMGGASEDVRALCKRMLSKEEHLRPTAKDALKHKWFASMNLATGSHDFKAVDREHVDSLLAVGQRSEFEKFISRFVATQVDASQQRSANEAFRMFDTDGDGLLSRDELRAGLGTFGARPELVEQVVNELDFQGTDQISYTAFLAGLINLRSKKPAEQDKLLWIAWEQFTPDSNGRVQASSIQKALAMRGLAVADLPQGFLDELVGKSSSGLVTFDMFKSMLLKDSSGKIARSLTQDADRGGKLLRWMMSWTA